MRLISRIVCSVLAVQTAVGPMALQAMAQQPVRPVPGVSMRPIPAPVRVRSTPIDDEAFAAVTTRPPSSDDVCTRGAGVASIRGAMDGRNALRQTQQILFARLEQVVTQYVETMKHRPNETVAHLDWALNNDLIRACEAAPSDSPLKRDFVRYMRDLAAIAHDDYSKAVESAAQTAKLSRQKNRAIANNPTGLAMALRRTTAGLVLLPSIAEKYIEGAVHAARRIKLLKGFIADHERLFPDTATRATAGHVAFIPCAGLILQEHRGIGHVESLARECQQPLEYYQTILGNDENTVPINQSFNFNAPLGAEVLRMMRPDPSVYLPVRINAQREVELDRSRGVTDAFLAEQHPSVRSCFPKAAELLAFKEEEGRHFKAYPELAEVTNEQGVEKQVWEIASVPGGTAFMRRRQGVAGQRWKLAKLRELVTATCSSNVILSDEAKNAFFEAANFQKFFGCSTEVVPSTEESVSVATRVATQRIADDCRFRYQSVGDYCADRSRFIHDFDWARFMASHGEGIEAAGNLLGCTAMPGLANVASRSATIAAGRIAGHAMEGLATAAPSMATADIAAAMISTAARGAWADVSGEIVSYATNPANFGTRFFMGIGREAGTLWALSGGDPMGAGAARDNRNNVYSAALGTASPEIYTNFRAIYHEGEQAHGALAIAPAVVSALVFRLFHAQHVNVHETPAVVAMVRQFGADYDAQLARAVAAEMPAAGSWAERGLNRVAQAGLREQMAQTVVAAEAALTRGGANVESVLRIWGEEPVAAARVIMKLGRQHAMGDAFVEPATARLAANLRRAGPENLDTTLQLLNVAISDEAASMPRRPAPGPVVNNEAPAPTPASGGGTAPTNPSGAIVPGGENGAPPAGTDVVPGAAQTGGRPAQLPGRTESAGTPATPPAAGTPRVGEGRSYSIRLPESASPEAAGQAVVQAVVGDSTLTPRQVEVARAAGSELVVPGPVLREINPQVGSEGPFVQILRTGGTARPNGRTVASIEVASALGDYLRQMVVSGESAGAGLATVPARVRAVLAAANTLSRDISVACGPSRGGTAVGALEDDLNAARANRGVASKKTKSKKSKKAKVTPATH